MRWIVAALVAVLVLPAARAGAGPLGDQIPPKCVAHEAMDNGVDLVDDYRCAGLAIEYHTAGAAFSPAPIWAGQWLFKDQSGAFRAGSCVFNRGLHPSIDQPAVVIDQIFRNDPTGEKSAYLTWRYGESADDLTAAGMWAVMHYYAQDAAGSRRAGDPTQPLVASLDTIGMASGRNDIQTMATALDTEATAHVGEWKLSLSADSELTASLVAGGQPVSGVDVSFLVSGRDDPVVAPTDTGGLAHAAFADPAGGTVVASVQAPGPALVFQGAPAGRSRTGGQRLVTGGAPRLLTATLDIPPTTATTSTSTTSTSTTTTFTSTTVPATIVIDETFPTLPPTTTVDTMDTTPASTSTVAAAVPAPQPGKPLPRTGKGTDRIAHVATMLMVAGIGVVGAASRRPPKGGHLHSPP